MTNTALVEKVLHDQSTEKLWAKWLETLANGNATEQTNACAVWSDHVQTLVWAAKQHTEGN